MKILLTALLIAASTAMQAQERRRSLGPYTMYEQIVYQAKQERIMEWLAGTPLRRQLLPAVYRRQPERHPRAQCGRDSTQRRTFG